MKKILFLILFLPLLIFGQDRAWSSSYQPSTNKDFLIEVAKGNIPGHSVVNKFGHNPSITTSTDPEDIWAGGGLYDFYPTTAQAMQVVSTSIEDDTGGSGAITMIFYGLDSNWDAINETITLDGQDTVNLVNSYIRMFRAVALTAGSAGTNVGTITVKQDGAGTDIAIVIAPTDGQTQQAIYTIPNNTTGYFIKGYVGISKGGGATVYAAEFKWKARLNNGTSGAWATKGQMECITHGSNWWQYEYGVFGGGIPEKSDIRIECFEVTGTVGVVGGFDLLLVQDGY